MEDSLDNKMLTDKELIDIVNRAPSEIECEGAYAHFLEDLAALVADHFGGEVDYTSSPVLRATEEFHVCDNCGRVHREGEQKTLDQCRKLTERLTPGGTVPSGECIACGAFVYPGKEDIDFEWIASIAHNECVPEDGWVYNNYDTDIDWNQRKAEEKPS